MGDPEPPHSDAHSPSTQEFPLPRGDVAYFDTSAWNGLMDHPDQNRVLHRLKEADVSVLASMFCATEIANTPQLDRRRALCTLIKNVHGDFPLLGHPMEIAVPIARAILDGEDDYLIPENPSGAILLRFLDDPTDEPQRQEFLEWRQRIEAKFETLFEKIKPPAPDPSINFLTRELVESQAMLEMLVLFEPAKEAGFTVAQMRQICDAPNDSIWTALRGMLAYWINIAYRHAGKRRPNAFDLWPSVYLGLPLHVFVTNDTRLLDAARQINGFQKIRRHVLTFEEFLVKLG